MRRRSRAACSAEGARQRRVASPASNVVGISLTSGPGRNASPAASMTAGGVRQLGIRRSDSPLARRIRRTRSIKSCGSGPATSVARPLGGPAVTCASTTPTSAAAMGCKSSGGSVATSACRVQSMMRARSRIRAVFHHCNDVGTRALSVKQDNCFGNCTPLKEAASLFLTAIRGRSADVTLDECRS
jgi:hypothetical protein